MDEQKKDVQETDIQENDTQKKGFKDVTDNMSRRSIMLWCLAGAYLVYTGYMLCSNVIKGTEGGNVGFFIAGLAFLVIGGGLLFFAVKGYLKSDKLRREEEQKEAEAAEGEEPAESEVVETVTEPKKKMSISERAALASRIDDETEE